MFASLSHASAEELLMRHTACPLFFRDGIAPPSEEDELGRAQGGRPAWVGASAPPATGCL